MSTTPPKLTVLPKPTVAGPATAAAPTPTVTVTVVQQPVSHGGRQYLKGQKLQVTAAEAAALGDFVQPFPAPPVQPAAPAPVVSAAIAAKIETIEKDVADLESTVNPTNPPTSK